MTGSVRATDSELVRDELSVLTIANALLRWRRTLLASIFLGGVIGLSVGLLTKRVYVARMSFIPQGAEQSTNGGLALAASQFGIRIPTGGGGWTPALYAEVLQSKTLLGPIATDTFVVTERGNSRIPLMDLLDVQASTPDARVEKAVVVLNQHISVIEDKKVGAVDVAVTTPWPSVSFGLAQRLVAGVNTFNVKTRQSQAKAEREFVEAQADAAEQNLREAEQRMQQFLQSNRVAGSPELRFEHDRLQRDIDLRQQAYTSLVQSYTEAKIREVRDTPVITVIEAPALPALGESRHTASKAALGALIGMIGGILLIAFRMARQSSDRTAREFAELMDQLGPRFLTRRTRT